MSNQFKFAFYEENSLTDLDGKIYVSKSSEYPIGFSADGLDLELFASWEGGEVENLLYEFKDMGLLDLDIGVEIDALIEVLRNKPVLFNRDLSPFCSINLSVLIPKSETVEISKLSLGKYYLQADEFVMDFPEFIIDFGEALEDKETLFYIGNHGILKKKYSSDPDLKKTFGHICATYMIIETLTTALNIFSSKEFLRTLEREVRNLLKNGCHTWMKSYTIDDKGWTGKDDFINTLKKYRHNLPEKYNSKLFGLYDEDIFYQHQVKRSIKFRIKVNPNSPFTPSEEYLKNQLNHIPSYNKIIHKGVRSSGDVVLGSFEYIKLERLSEYYYVLHIEQYPKFGAI